MPTVSDHASGVFPQPVVAFSQENIPIGRKHVVDFSVCEGIFLAQWSPDVPKGNALCEIYPAYLTARNKFFGRVAAQGGGAIIAVNPNGSINVITGSTV